MTAGDAPLSEFVESYVVTHRQTPASQKIGRMVLGRFVREVGDVPPGELTREHVQAWWSAVSPPAAPSSRRADDGHVRAFLRWLRDGDLVAGNLMSAVARPPVARSNPRTFVGDEVARLRAECRSLRDLVIVELMWGLALRCIEVASLRIGDVDWNELLIVVRGKGGHVDVLPLPAATAAVLADYLAQRPPVRGEDGSLIRRLRGEDGLQPHTVSVIVSKIATRAGVKQSPWDGRGAHGLRRTCASDLLDSGATIRQVQQVLRHQSLATTEHYLRRSSADELRAILGGHADGDPVAP